MTNKAQWLFELTRLLERDREKSSKEKSVRLYFGKNRPEFVHQNRTFIAERRVIDLSELSINQNEVLESDEAKEENSETGTEPENTGNDDITAKTSFVGFYQDNHEPNGDLDCEKIKFEIPANQLKMITSMSIYNFHAHNMP